MKTYRRILLPIFSQGQSDILLHRVRELAQRRQTQLLLLRILDTRGMEPDGPAAALPGETMSRRAPGLLKRLELQLACNHLAWAEAKVVWGDPEAELAAAIRAWRPDLLVTAEPSLPEEIAGGADILKVRASGILGRLTDTLRHFSLQHA